MVIALEIRGPLLGLHNFDPSVIRWCLMHVFHLGLLFSANGSSLIPFCAKQVFLLLFVSVCVHKGDFVLKLLLILCFPPVDPSAVVFFQTKNCLWSQAFAPICWVLGRSAACLQAFVAVKGISRLQILVQSQPFTLLTTRVQRVHGFLHVFKQNLFLIYL